MWHKHFRERLRSKAVRDLQSAGATTGPGLDRFVEQAAEAFAAAAAVISLIRDDRQIIAAAHGLAFADLPRRKGVCNHVLDSGSILEICDPLSEKSFQRLPCVTGHPHVRYYIGAPLTVFGATDVGVLCVVNMHARPPASADQRAYLTALARQVSATLEHHLAVNGAVAA